MRKFRSTNNFFAECLIEDRLGTSETGVKDFFIDEQPCVVETRGCLPNRVGRKLMETDDELVENAADCVSFAVFRAKPTGIVESQVAKDSKTCSTKSVESAISTKLVLIMLNCNGIRRQRSFVSRQNRIKL